jgi:dipeptidyl aminopeptidase/acylaminoacyl peptidase
LRAFRPRDIFHLRRLGDVAIAPDGQTVAYSLAEADQRSSGYSSSIYRLSLDDRTPRSLTHGARDGRPWYAPDGRHLAFLRQDAGADQVHLLPLSGGEALQLTALGHGVSDYAWGPHGRQMAVLSPVGPGGRTARQLYRFDLDGTWRQLSDDELDHRDPTFAPGGRHIACVLVQPAGSAAIATVPVDGGTWHRLTPWTHAWARPVFSPDGEAIYALGTTEGEGPALWRIDLRGEAGMLSQVPWPDAFLPYLTPGRPTSPDLFVTGDGQSLLGLLHTPEAAVLARCSLPHGRWHVEQTHGLRIQSFAANASGERTVLLAGPPDQPPEVLLRDENGRVALRSDHHELLLADVDFTAPSLVGRRECGAALLLPATHKAAPLAVILGDVGDAATGGSSSLLAQVLCGRGVAVLRVPLEPVEMSRAVREPERAAAQVRDLVADALQGHAVDGSRLALLGEGRAGYLALMLLTLSSTFRAAATLGAPTDLVSLWGSGDLPSATGIDDLPPPWQVPRPYLQGSPLLRANRIEAALLLLHGQEDGVVPADQARELARALATLGREVRCEIYPGLGHEPLHAAPLRLQAQILDVAAGFIADQLAR